MADIVITDKADTPKRQRTDEGSNEERPIKDIIDAINYESVQTAVTRPPFGLHIARSKPRGTVN
jgi:hypothetical protein